MTPKRLALWRRRVQRISSTIIVVVLISLVAGAFDPFSLSDAVNARAGNVLQSVAAPFYSAPQGTAGQQAVTVVLIDQRYFDAVAARPEGGQASWPLPVRTLAMGIIRPIIDADPAALFVDIAFADTPREIVPGGPVDREQSAARLGEWLRLLANRTPETPQGPGTPVPLILADGYEDVPGVPNATNCPIRYLASEDVARQSETATTVRDAMFRPGAALDLLPANLEMVDSSPIVSNGYLLAPSMTGPRRGCRVRHDRHQGYVASPALALYHAYGSRCDPVASPGCPAARRFASTVVRDPTPNAVGIHPYGVATTGGRSDGDAAAATAARLEGTLAPRWGVLMTDRMRDTFAARVGADACRSQFFGTSLFGRTQWFGVRVDAVAAYLGQMFHPVERAFGAELQRPCAYIDTISAADLLDQRSLTGSGSGSIARDFLKGRIVLLGASIPQVGDRFASPVSGDLPGVYQHAVAVENLVTSDGRYADANGGWGRFIGVVLLTSTLVVVMSALWETLMVVGCRWFGTAGELLLVPVVYYLAMLVVAGAALVILRSAGLPLGATLSPLMSLHVVFFARWLETLRVWLDRSIGRIAARWRRHGAEKRRNAEPAPLAT